MRTLLDINVLIALFDPGHTHHRLARRWWHENHAEGWASCPLTQNGFLRIVTQRAYPRSLAFPDALRALRSLVDLPSHQFWPNDISTLDTAVFDHARMLMPSQITDVYLLALAVRNRGRFATFDRGVPSTAVRGASAAQLAVLL